MRSLALFAALLACLCFTTPARSKPPTAAEKPPAATRPAAKPAGKSTAKPAGKSTAKPAEGYRFAWPIPGKAEVTHVGVKKGNTVKMQYRLAIEPGPKGKGARVRFADLEVLELNGQAVDPKIPEVQQMRAQLVAMMPDIVVDASGQFVEAAGLEEKLRKTAAFFAKLQGASPEETKRMEAMMNTPQIRAAVATSASDLWGAWVGLWIELALKPGEELKRPSEFPLPDGSSVTAPVVARRSDKGAGSLAELSYESKLSGEKVTAAMVAWFRSMEARGGAPTPDVNAVERETKIRASIAPATLKPARVVVEKIIRVKVDGRDAPAQIERNEYTFRWLE